MNEIAKKLAEGVLKEDSELDFKIKNNIEMYRKGFGKINLISSDGEEINRANIKIRQKNHEYKFGCNCFMLNQFPDDEKNRKYEEYFTKIFNLAVAPFYWKDLEVEEAQERFETHTPHLYRRPQPDLVCDFCDQNDLVVKGHPLAWHQFWPDWVPDDRIAIRDLWERRFARIAERYAKRIPIWDVYNEAQTSNNRTLPRNHVETAFELAEKYFPGCKLNYNDDNMWFHYSAENTPPYLLVEKLIRKGLKVGGIGFQYHMFDWLIKNNFYEKFMNSAKLYQIFDQFSLLNLPISMSEVSIISKRDLGDGDHFQEIVAEKLYKVWFSHPVTDEIVWWNLVDGTCHGAPLGSEHGENRLRAGLINYDMTPKPAYNAIQRLITKEWWTKCVTLDYVNGGDNRFQGFYGDYEIEIETNKGCFTKKIKLSKHSSNTFTINI